jgi:hypothetical protein
MVTLTLTALLSYMSADFCHNRASGYDTVRSVLISYSNASTKFGVNNVREVIRDNRNLEAVAIASVVARCPSRL